MPENHITYLDPDNMWVDISTSVAPHNNGGHKEHQYFMGTVSNVNKILYYYDGQDFNIIEALDTSHYAVADIAVDTLGRAWIFEGNGGTSVSQLNVYDKTGLLTSYAMTFDNSHCYGSFFLNNTLYIGMGSSAINPNTITPVVLNGDQAQLGTPIPFTNDIFYDMASCQTIEKSSATSELINYDLTLYPNPTTGLVYFSNDKNIVAIDLISPNGIVIDRISGNKSVDLTELPCGVYFLKIILDRGYRIKKIIKQ